VIACTIAIVLAADARAQRGPPPERYRPGVSVLLDDQLSLIRNRRIALIADADARDERGKSVIDLFKSDRRATAARVTISALISPGVRSDDPPDERDVRAGARVEAALDGVTAPVDLILVDLVDLGVRDAAAPWALLAALRGGAKRHAQVVILDRPDPLTGEHAEGPVPDSIAATSDGLYGLPSRHGMTLGEMAKWFVEAGHLDVTLTVMPVRGWRRSAWPPDKARAAGEALSGESLILRGAFAAFAATNLDVTIDPQGRSATVGAPWLDARRVATVLADRLIPDAEFSAVRTRNAARGADLPAVRIEITDRDRASGWRIATAVLSAIRAAHKDQLVFDAQRFDRLAFGSALRRAIVAGEDSDAIVDRGLADVISFRRRAHDAYLYR
jgi:uncharacterized protein YbbC (DUF1343 family)